MLQMNEQIKLYTIYTNTVNRQMELIAIQIIFIVLINCIIDTQVFNIWSGNIFMKNQTDAIVRHFRYTTFN